MTTLASQPDEATLRRFLLGTLPPDDADCVAKWVEENPGAAVVLRDIEARDTVVDAIGDVGTMTDAPSVPQLVHTSVQVSTPVTSRPVAVGGFRVIREIGRGGMGIVLAAEDTHLKRLVAVKLIATEFATNPAARDRFLREARAVAKIEHENVVPILHVGEDAGQLYLVMPLLKGETLDARLRRDTRLPVDELQRIGREVAAGLAAAHAVGLVHRDVKPANIWLEAGTGRVKLLDFGLAKPTEEADADAHLTDTGAVMGTAYYMAPEQAEGKPVDSRTDLFSLGAVLYHAATGQRPFRGETKLAVLIAVTSDTPPRAEKLNTSLPPRLAALLRALLEKNPKDRPASATEVIAELQPDAPVVFATPVAAVATPWDAIDKESEEVVASPAPVRPQQKMRPTSRWKRGAVAAGVLFAAAVLVAAVVVIVRDKNGKEVARIEVPEGGAVEIKNSVDRGKPGAKPVNDPDRKAAEYVLSIRGRLAINHDEANFNLMTSNPLPKGPIMLKAVYLHANQEVSDRGMAAFVDCRNLTYLWLNNTQVSDEGLGHLTTCDTLRYLMLDETRVGDEGLAQLKQCKKLTGLSISGTRVTDAGMTHLADFQNLGNVNLDNTAVSDTGFARLKERKSLYFVAVKNTKVTAKGITNLAKALPGCQILCDGGAIEPTDPNLHAALWVLAGGGSVKINGSSTDIFQATDLPSDPIHSWWVSYSNRGATDGNLAIFKHCKGLTHADLRNTTFTDAGMVHFYQHSNLKLLNLRSTKVSKDGVTELAKALPQCRIEWDGGVIESAKK